MYKIGITGGIGSGKSVVSSILKVMNIPIYDADSRSKGLLVSDGQLRSSLISLLGEKIYDGAELNRAEMAQIIFQNDELLRKTNELVHPAVRRDCLSWFNLHSKCEIVAVESALIYEAQFESILDKVIMVYAPMNLRIMRAAARDGVSPEKIEQRIKCQMSDDLKREKSDFVIVNDNSVAILPQVLEIIRAINGGC